MVKKLYCRYLILLNSITLKSNSVVSGIQWLIKCPFCLELHFRPFTGLSISKTHLSPHVKLIINATQNTVFYELMVQCPQPSPSFDDTSTGRQADHRFPWNNISFFYANARSIVNKVDLLGLHLADKVYDVFVLVDTHLDSSIA